MKAEIRPFVQSVLDGRANLEKIDYYTFRLKDFARNEMLKVIMGWPEYPFSGPSIEYMLFAYLGIVETLGNTIVDIIIMLIIANGKDFHIESEYRTPRVKHVERIFDLNRVPLATKLNFLRDNGIKTLPSMIDSKLRNDIAHLNFTFNPDTKEISIRNRPIKEVVNEGFNRLNMISKVYDELDKLEKILRKDS
jgi:hypothetical protein